MLSKRLEKSQNILQNNIWGINEEKGWFKETKDSKTISIRIQRKQTKESISSRNR